LRGLAAHALVDVAVGRLLEVGEGSHGHKRGKRGALGEGLTPGHATGAADLEGLTGGEEEGSADDLVQHDGM
jgi:hypothetical protein